MCVCVYVFVPRAMAFLKRLAIASTYSTAPIAAALMLIISEIFAVRPSLLVLLTSAESTEASIAPKDAGNSQSDRGIRDPVKTREEGGADRPEEVNWQVLGGYDASKREPAFAVRSIPPLWELCLLKNHFHPSVQAFSQSLLSKSSNHFISFDGDPTVDFSLSSFLNRFAYKKPKKQQIEKAKESHHRKQRSINEQPVNEEAIDADNLALKAPDKAFFMKFFGDRARLLERGQIRDRTARKKSRTEGVDEDEEEEMDRYADKLADDLLRGGDAVGPDIDDDDDDDMEGDSDGGDLSDDVDDELSGGDDMDDDESLGGLDFDEEKDDDRNQDGKSNKNKKGHNDMKALLQRAMSAAENDDEDGDEFEDLMGDGGEDDEEGALDLDSDDGDVKPSGGGKRKKSNLKDQMAHSKKKGFSSAQSSFADADAYEAEMDAIVSRQKRLEEEEESTAAIVSTKTNARRPPGKRRKRKYG